MVAEWAGILKGVQIGWDAVDAITCGNSWHIGELNSHSVLYWFDLQDIPFDVTSFRAF